MRKITIVYDKNRSNPPSDVLIHLLSEAGYDITICNASDTEQWKTCFINWKKSLPDLIVTINLAGLSNRTTSDDSAYNLIPTNIIHFIPELSQCDTALLSGLHTLSTAFCVTSSKDASLLKKICDIPFNTVYTVPSLEESMLSILSKLDWRKKESAD